MKKTLLTVIAVALSAATTMADVHTIVFDGKSELAGLSLQTFQNERALTTAATEGTVEFVPEVSLTEEGIDLSIKKTSESGYGYALVNAGGTNSGLCVYSYIAPETHINTKLSLTVPGGKIKAVKLYMSGYAAYNLALSFNDTEIEPERDNDLFYWLWSDEAGAETVSCSWGTKYGIQYIHSIEVIHTGDLGGKEECGLAFSETSAEAVMGEDFTAPELYNPNNLPVTWSSSDENVATVAADGTVTLVGGGKTIIKAETTGNDTYAKGFMIYKLTVIPAAANIAEMMEMAPDRFDKIKVNFPATVTFANGNYAFVIDAEGNAGYIQNIRNLGSTSTTAKTIYKAGEVIPAGWIATNDVQYEEILWQGIPADVTETVEVEYPEVTAVTPADVNRVVILKDVTFTTRTASGNTKAYGTTPDGKRYEFQDTYDVKQKPAGTYDVKLVVRYSVYGSTVYFYVSPIEYIDTDKSGISEIEAAGTDARYYNLQGVEVANPRNGVFVKVADGKASKVIVK